MKTFCRLVVLFSLTFLGQQFYAQKVLIINKETSRIKLGKHLYYFESKDKLNDEDVLSGKHDHKFLKSNKDALNFGVTTSDIWLKITVVNKDDATERILRIKNALLDNVKLFFQNNKREWNMLEAGDEFIFDKRKIKDHNHCFRINLEPGKAYDFYLKANTSGSMQLPLELHTTQDYEKRVLINELSYGLFSGALIIMVIYNLFLFFGIKDYSYLAYSLFIIVNLLLMNAYSGHNFKLFLGNYPRAAALSIPLLMALTPFTVSLYSLTFLGPKNIKHSIRVSLYSVLVISLALVVLVFILPIRATTTMSGILIIVTLIIAILAGLSSWIEGYIDAKYYVMAWSLLIVSGLITAFRNFGFLDYNYFTVHGARFATVIEVALLSFSLTSKYTRIQREKEDAQNRIIVMQRKANIVLEQKVEERTKELQIEREKSEKLLLNVLPLEIANELKEKGKSIPKSYKLTSILFVDIKNFTSFVEELMPNQIIEILNQMFYAFDEICRRNNLEKIKTLGDGYMAVGGLPKKNQTNPKDAVRSGLEMQKWVRDWNETHNSYNTKNKIWEIRVGINTGEVIAGVIGKHKFAYDIWGDAVNLASRMESSGEVGKVSISSNTYNYIKDTFECVYQGKVAVKNKGKVDIYQVVAEKNN
jgi:class 3 adenylate cyclase